MCATEKKPFYFEKTMYELSLQRWLNQPIVINKDKLENISSQLTFLYKTPPLLDHLPLNIGSERSLDVIWSALMFPQLTEGFDSTIPIWMSNFKVLGTHLSNGIDLFSPSVAKNLDVADLHGLFPATLNPDIAKDVSLCFSKLLTFNHSNDVLKSIADESVLNIYLKQWNAWASNEEFFQVLGLIPLVEAILTRAHISFTMNTQNLYVDPICAQAVWNTGILDETISKDSEELPEEILGGVGSVMKSLCDRTNHSSGQVVRALHGLFQTQIEQESCRPWLWGHTTQ